MEKCVRCGEVEEDRRTLWMACFYEMNELGIPFIEYKIKGILQDKIGEEESKVLKGVMLDIFSEEGTEFDRPFYTLRVCKDCRADWMQAIKDWFNYMPDYKERPSTGTGVFIRELGICKELTEEEIKETFNV
jgi:hypothetical protein